MTLRENESQWEGSTGSSTVTGKFTSLISRFNLWNKLKKSKEVRARFVDSHLSRSLAYQIRSLREDATLTQAQFAEVIGVNHPNNVSARLENPHYGKHTLTTLKKIAAACDVGLAVWFVPFSRMVDWATGTPYIDKGLRPSFYNISAFDKDALPAVVSGAGNADHLRGAQEQPKELIGPGAKALTVMPREQIGDERKECWWRVPAPAAIKIAEEDALVAALRVGSIGIDETPRSLVSSPEDQEERDPNAAIASAGPMPPQSVGAPFQSTFFAIRG